LLDLAAQSPQTFLDWLLVAWVSYRDACRDAGREGDEELRARVERTLEAGEAASPD